MLHLATWNVNSLKARLEHLRDWVRDANPDVLALQEIKCADEAFPAAAVRALGFEHVVYTGQKTYNGVAILSRHPLSDVVLGFRLGEDDPQRRLIRATVAGVRVVCCYVPNGSEVGSEKFAYKLAWLDRLRAELVDEGVGARPSAVVGDMNVALDDRSVWDPFGMDGELLYHPLEREKMQALLATGLVDSYRANTPDGRDFSWWDYRAMAFPRNRGARIDHVLLSTPAMAMCRDVRIGKVTRGWEKPSDHAPVSVFLDV